jgi:hypothetical protein
MGALRNHLGRRSVIVGGAAGLMLIAAIVTAIALTGGGTSASNPGNKPTPTPTATATATPTVPPSPTPVPHAGILDGVPMTAEEWAARRDLLPVAVMIDNTAHSVPHHGLGQADLVYETFVEGGITRLMAVFWRNEAELVMPVRSARTPFVIWVDELGALYGHAGSATTTNEANAHGQIFEWGIPDLDAFKPASSGAYYRVSSRFAPYNLATSTERLRTAAAALDFAGPPTVESWKFRNPGDAISTGEPAGGIEIDFSGRRVAWQLIQWRWDESRRAYGRSQFGGPHVDANTGEQLFFTTIIVMRANTAVVDASGHVLLEQFGEGPVIVYTGGQAITGTWRKADRKARTRFFDPNGTEIAFERGPIFIQVIGPQSVFTHTASAADLPPLPRYVPPPPSPGPVEDDDLPPEPTPTVEPTATPTAPATPDAATPTATPEAEGTPTPAPTAEQTAPTPDVPTPTPTASPTPYG